MYKVPKAYLELCTRSVLVMEELTGDKLVVALQRDMEQLAAYLRESPEQFTSEEQEKNIIALEKKCCGWDPPPPNTTVPCHP